MQVDNDPIGAPVKPLRTQTQQKMAETNFVLVNSYVVFFFYSEVLMC